MLKLLSKICLVVLLAFALSLGADFFYRKALGLSYQFPRNIFILPQIKSKYELVKVGNSHAEDGLTFGKYKVKHLSLSSVAQTFEFDLALLKMYSQQIKKNAVVVINVSPISFSQIKPKSDDTVNMQYYDGRLSPFLIPRIKVSEYLQIQIFPFLRSGYLWREKHAAEVKDKSMGAFAENVEKKENKPSAEISVSPQTGPAPVEPPYNIHSDTATYKVSEIQAVLDSRPVGSDERLTGSVEFMSNKWLKTDGFGTNYFDTNRADLQKLIDYCLERGWQPVLITLPISQKLESRLGENYMNLYLYDNLDKVNKKNARYINYSTDQRLVNNGYLFGNSDHLNKKGAVIVSYLLLRKLIDDGLLPQNADGYEYP
jgi:hypothetical protein